MNGLGVIFDMDGVLVDSYRAHFESWRRLADEQGCTFTEADFVATFGRTSREILTECWPADLPAEQVSAADDRKEALYRQAIREEFPEMPGARDLVRALHAAGFALAVGSSGPRANIDVCVAGLDLPGLFSAIITREDVTRGKPEPEVFLVAADRLGVPPARCAVVEDAPAGIEAANRAGMTSIALTGTATADALADADLIVASLAELTPARIAELIDGDAV